MRRLQLPGGLGIYLPHVLADIEAATEDGDSVLVLQFDVAASTEAPAAILTPASPHGTKVTTSPAQLILTPEQSAAYRKAVESFTIEGDAAGGPPRVFSN